MAKSGWHPQLVCVLGRQELTDPPTEMRRGSAQVDGDIEHLSPDYPHEFSLTLFNLVVKPEQCSIG